MRLSKHPSRWSEEILISPHSSTKLINLLPKNKTRKTNKIQMGNNKIQLYLPRTLWHNRIQHPPSLAFRTNNPSLVIQWTTALVILKLVQIKILIIVFQDHLEVIAIISSHQIKLLDKITMVILLQWTTTTIAILEWIA